MLIPADIDRRNQLLWDMSNLAVDAIDDFERLLDRVQKDPGVRYGTGLTAELREYRTLVADLRRRHEELHGAPSD